MTNVLYTMPREIDVTCFSPRALIWAALIFAFAIIAEGRGWDSDFSLIVTLAMSGMAVAHLYRDRDRSCSPRGC